ncbi:hypothetical protein J2Z23_004132 [Lederbergia galactosidilyticus]|uniref:hypothetical protein n=1 Tax=Lederbergia galactosidilytica TaxID=217031 RepID=UPI000FFE5925|nr:hypothetical protein [Lederbergia galactosidilytica]MBP1917147.1 hypothetical protein [Lederbergia galactosidilytica]
MNKLGFVIITFFALIGLVGCSNETMKKAKESWEESPTLIREIIVTDDGQTDDFIFRIGDTGKLGFGEYGPFIEEESQKYIWHFLGRGKVINTARLRLVV